MNSYYIGVDGGGTNTRAVVLNEALDVLGRGEAPSSNLYNVGLAGAIEHVQQAVQGALQVASVPMAKVASWGLGLAGAHSDTEKDYWREALLPVVNGASFIVEDDAMVTLVGAFGTDLHTNGGIILIAGTGANCFGQNKDGKRFRKDGIGPLLGDRGSGYWIGERALRLGCEALEGMGAPTGLGKAVLEHFDVPSMDELIPVVYEPGFRRDRIAALTPHVAKLAQAGDEVCRALLQSAGVELARTLRAVVEPSGVKRVALVGGLLDNVSEIRVALEAAVPEVEFTAAKYEPVVGAALLGMGG